ncbi:MAG: aminotransferase class V-fold PLP-dependent enzyme [Saprospiraceae bacterium]|nr:aminotransferase class V-fold PLP-dependent enzyme [Saprospiraceae bacterium]|tara:strand:- start:2242 stop:3510 length:1269 start_codon:yes stop_codon:yes gene_type:complete
MINRRKAIRNAILGLGVATVPRSLFQKLTVDDKFKIALNIANENPDKYWQLIQSQFNFANGIRYFNNASLGSSPLSVIEAREEYSRTLESFPSKYMWGGWKDQINEVRIEAAKFINAESDEIAIIHNTTEGMNVIASSLNLKPGDEVIVGDHEHRTGVSPWLFHQEKKGIKIIRPILPLTPDDPQEIVETYKKVISPRTKAISMVHITNTNGMILPVKEICAIASEKNILTLIDGAQSLGAYPCDVKKIGCDYFTASGHKWLFSPKGVALFYARKESQKWLKPFIANYNYDKDGISKIDDYNTRNLPDVLGMGAAIQFHKMIGLKSIMARTLDLKKRFLSRLKDHPQFKIKTPLGQDQSHHILTIEKIGTDVNDLKESLFNKNGIDVRGMSSHNLNGIRISFAMYQKEEDIDLLIDTLLNAE